MLFSPGSAVAPTAALPGIPSASVVAYIVRKLQELGAGVFSSAFRNTLNNVRKDGDTLKDGEPDKVCHRKGLLMCLVFACKAL